MKREFLKNLGLTDEQVNQIMTENGNDIEKYRKEVESKTKELETLNTKYESAQNSLKYKDETAELNNKLTNKKETLLLTHTLQE